MVYFLQVKEGGPIKIGCTCVLEFRLEAHYLKIRQPICIWGVMPGRFELETMIHLAFRHLRVQGKRAKLSEWFEPHPDLIAFIEAVAIPWDGGTIGYVADCKSQRRSMATVRRAVRKLKIKAPA